MKHRNWAGNVRFHPQRLEMPRGIEELQELVIACARQGVTIRAVGAGHSFSPLIETEHVLVCLDKICDLGRMDEQGVATVAGGIRLGALGKALHERGRGLENLGDIDVQSIAGAVSTGTHGTGLRFGSLSTQVEWMDIIRGDGEVERVHRKENPETFQAAATSLGMLGMIVSLGLRTVPSYQLEVRQFAEDFSRAVQSFDERITKHRHHEFFWFPHTQTVLSKISDETDGVAEVRGGFRRFVEDVVLENGVLELFNRSVGLFPGQTRIINELLAFLSRHAGGKTASGPSHQIFATQRLCRFVEMEYALPLAKLGQVLERLQRWIVDEKIAVAFPIEVRCARGDDLWLSPAYKRDSAFVAVHMHHTQPHEAFFRGAESIFRTFDGRPHWGKINTLQATELRALYPQWEAFHSVRQRFDPNGTFLNAQTRRMC